METYFTDYFKISPTVLDEYGAFNISLITDLPLFVDPFLLFNSKKGEYQRLHEGIVRYLRFLREKSRQSGLSGGLLKAWYRFPEVKQNWLGFSKKGNAGTGLGGDFASALHDNLHRLFPEFGSEIVTKGSHLEKLCLVREGVGRDNISDFTTNLIKQFLCEYTQEFAQTHFGPKMRRDVAVERVSFNYETETWEPRRFELPWVGDDYVLLTPKDILTKDDTWINRADLVNDFREIPTAIDNDALRGQINNYFSNALVRRPGKEPTEKEKSEAARRTLLEFPQLIDYYIRYKEKHGDEAESLSSAKVRLSEELYVAQIKALQQTLESNTKFYEVSGSTYDEARTRVEYLKDVIENKGGHRIFYAGGKPIEREHDLHIMYRLVWFGTPSDVTREANDGRGPPDFKVSRGATDKTVVEFKLASNSQLERNLERQVEIYQKAADAKHALKVIIFFSDSELDRAIRILNKLKLNGHRDIFLIDARADNKPSASKA